jgi:hypothetical protein
MPGGWAEPATPNLEWGYEQWAQRRESATYCFRYPASEKNALWEAWLDELAQRPTLPAKSTPKPLERCQPSGNRTTQRPGGEDGPK